MTPQQLRRKRDAELIRARHRLTFTGQYEQQGPLRWYIEVPELYAATSALRFEEIEGAVRDLVALSLDVDRDAFDVTLRQIR